MHRRPACTARDHLCMTLTCPRGDLTSARRGNHNMLPIRRAAGLARGRDGAAPAFPRTRNTVNRSLGALLNRLIPAASREAIHADFALGLGPAWFC
jgi:hypothetical protein